jgi:hypothetical protein
VASKPAVKAEKQVQEVEHWVCNDVFNTYWKVVYSDGSVKYLMGWGDSVRQISDPGDWGWKLVKRIKTKN